MNELLRKTTMGNALTMQTKLADDTERHHGEHILERRSIILQMGHRKDLALSRIRQE
jgi:hypothetical protein